MLLIAQLFYFKMQVQALRLHYVYIVEENLTYEQGNVIPLTFPSVAFSQQKSNPPICFLSDLFSYWI